MFFRRDPDLKHEGRFLLLKVRLPSGEEVLLRISKTSELSPVPEGYFVRKVIVGPKSLERAVLELTLDRSLRPRKKVLEGAVFVPVREWKDED